MDFLHIDLRAGLISGVTQRPSRCGQLAFLTRERSAESLSVWHGMGGAGCHASRAMRKGGVAELFAEESEGIDGYLLGFFNSNDDDDDSNRTSRT